jgi:hypothetical protein
MQYREIAYSNIHIWEGVKTQKRNPPFKGGLIKGDYPKRGYIFINVLIK